jgi:Protein of unknown function (DUF1176)
MMFRISCFLGSVILLSSFAFAEEGYLDNRSAADELVHSLYNAVNRHEFVRAYDYFAVPPAKDYASYAKGFDDTLHVDVMTGDVSSEGAAGTVYFTVPTLVRARDKSGLYRVFSGCYTVKALAASAQEPPFRPLLIDKGQLKSAGKDDFVLYMLPKCGAEINTPDEDASIDKAKALFVSEQKNQCGRAVETRGGANEPTVYKFKFYRDGDADNDPPQVATLFEFQCFMGAYNEVNVFYLHTKSDGLAGVSFAKPHLKIEHPAGDDAGRVLKSMTIDGYLATRELINPQVDEKLQSITTYEKWRGLGDASSSGTWLFQKGEFVLKDFSADPTYNDEADPIEIISNGIVR